MAFNPFESLRKNSKAILSVVTILVVFIFVLSSGGGRGHDITDLIDRAFRGTGSTGAKLAEVNGKAVYQRDLEKLNRRRIVANAYVTNLSLRADENLAADLMKRVAKLPQDQAGTGKAIENYLKFRPNMRPEFFNFIAESALSKIDVFREGFKKDSEELKTLMDARGLIIRHAQRLFQTSPMYFDSIPNRDINDRMNFYLLLVKADQWGINYGRKSVESMINDEIGTGFTDRDAADIRLAIRTNYRDTTDDEIFEAVADEFRARTVLFALAGRSNNPIPGQPLTISGTALVTTPYDFFQKYQDLCSTHDYLLLGIDAESILKDKTKVPEPNDNDPNTKRELADIYKEGRANDPNPFSSTPGFRKPKEFMVQYLKHDPQLPFYDKIAAQLNAYHTFASVTSIPIIGGGIPANSLLAIGDKIHERASLYKLAEPKIDAFERSYSQAELYPPYRRTYNDFILRDMAILTIGTNWLPNYSLPYLHHEALRQLDARERAKIGIPVVAGLATSFPLNPLNVIAPALVSYPKSRTEYFMQQEIPTLAKNNRDRLPEDDIQDLTKALQEKIADANTPEPKGEKEKTEWKLKADTAKANAKLYLETWAKARGYEIKSASKPQSEFTIVNDPGLKELVEQTEKDKLSQKEFRTIPEIALRVFGRDDQLYSLIRATNPPSPFEDASSKGPVYYLWRTEMIPAKEHGARYELLPDEVKAAVKHEWRLRKARTLLDAEAKALSEQVKAITQRNANNPEGLKKEMADFAAQKGLKLITSVKQLSVYQDIGGAHNFANPSAQSYPVGRVKESPDIPYPSEELTNALLSLRNKPAGEVAIAKNGPKTVAYIGVLTNTQKATVEAFLRIFSRSSFNLQPQSRNPQGLPNPLARDPFQANFVSFDVFSRNQREVFDRLKAELHFKETDAFRRTDKGDE
ncbi:MAG: hypothetical protein N2112_05280 [Gemmataceae bacterium]|jgi:hypothetical protein|nr:hypothetical protein [Gemmataceae bacterium]